MVFLGLFALFLDKKMDKNKWCSSTNRRKKAQQNNIETVFMKNVSKYPLTYVNKKIKRRKIH